ncbi:MAG: RNA polymerase sigma factor [Velocimicrobium sp.]
MESYSNLVYSICYKITNNCFDAQDLAQETFLSVYKSLPSFDGENEQAWISKIATNKCLDYIKSAGKRSIPTNDEYFKSIQISDKTPEDFLLEKNEKEYLLSLCTTLKPPYDTVAINYFYHEMTVAEIASASGKKTKTIQTQVYRAKNLLKCKWRKEI